VIFEQMEQVLRERLQALPPAARAELLHVLMLPTSSGPTGSESSGATHRAAPPRDRGRGSPRLVGSPCSETYRPPPFTATGSVFVATARTSPR
jgi:hypothetical protein